MAELAVLPLDSPSSVVVVPAVLVGCRILEKERFDVRRNDEKLLGKKPDRFIPDMLKSKKGLGGVESAGRIPPLVCVFVVSPVAATAAEKLPSCLNDGLERFINVISVSLLSGKDETEKPLAMGILSSAEGWEYSLDEGGRFFSAVTLGAWNGESRGE